MIALRGVRGGYGFLLLLLGFLLLCGLLGEQELIKLLVKFLGYPEFYWINMDLDGIVVLPYDGREWGQLI